MIVPAYQASAFLRESLPRLVGFAAKIPVLVVDAGSSDGTSELATSLGARVLRLPQREGPARARNLGADALEADVLLFLDSDCVPHHDTLERVQAAFEAEPELVALCGSYDAAPPEQDFFSQYMNLRHHFTHQHASREPATFWAGCGAVRRSAFLQAGGFDAERYARPQIEDIELAYRMRPLGRVRLDPELQVTHLKRWTLRSVVETDIACRALPWARLVAERGELPNDLNMRGSQRLAAAVAPLALVSLVILPWAAWTNHWIVVALALLAPTLSWMLNRPMISFFAQLRGRAFAIGAWLFHQVHLSYAAPVFAGTLALHRAKRRAR